MTHKHLGWLLIALGAYGLVGPSLMGANYKALPVWSTVENSFSAADLVAAGVGVYLVMR